MNARFAELESELHATASRMTGLSDFGATDYRRGFAELLHALDTDCEFSATGRQFAYGTVLGTLTARLHAEEGWKRHPESRAHVIRKPLVITGVPRTGTTALHKLLSMDPQFQGLEHWLSEAPMVRPPRERWPQIPEYRASVAALESYFELMPQMRAAHDIVADEVDECLEVLRQDFVSNRFASGMPVPSYEAWFRAQDERPSYRRYAAVLRLIGAAEPEKRWLLKNPGHIAQPEALLEVFPDACIVQTHRHPVKALPSLCSTLLMSRRMFEGEAARAELIGPRECEYWGSAVEAAQRARERNPRQFFDVDHSAIYADPLGTVRAIYDRFELTLAPSAAARMQGWIAANPPGKHGEHRYDVASFGISAEDIRRRFADYIDRHGL
jgi:hypothetical protein